VLELCEKKIPLADWRSQTANKVIIKFSIPCVLEKLQCHMSHYKFLDPSISLPLAFGFKLQCYKFLDPSISPPLEHLQQTTYPSYQY